MLEQDVYEPLELVKQAIQSASEVTISILRIDDIIEKRGIDGKKGRVYLKCLDVVVYSRDSTCVKVRRSNSNL